MHQIISDIISRNEGLCILRVRIIKLSKPVQAIGHKNDMISIGVSRACNETCYSKKEY